MDKGLKENVAQFEFSPLSHTSTHLYSTQRSTSACPHNTATIIFTTEPIPPRPVPLSQTSTRDLRLPLILLIMLRRVLPIVNMLAALLLRRAFLLLRIITITPRKHKFDNCRTTFILVAYQHDFGERVAQSTDSLFLRKKYNWRTKCQQCASCTRPIANSFMLQIWN